MKKKLYSVFVALAGVFIPNMSFAHTGHGDLSVSDLAHYSLYHTYLSIGILLSVTAIFSVIYLIYRFKSNIACKITGEK